MREADIVRIAMWSGPRNISTTMMRSFENRPDTVVIDEPFYGCYLTETGADHPYREETLAARVLTAEHATYPAALALLARGDVRMTSAGKAVFRS